MRHIAPSEAFTQQLMHQYLARDHMEFKNQMDRPNQQRCSRTASRKLETYSPRFGRGAIKNNMVSPGLLDLTLPHGAWRFSS